MRKENKFYESIDLIKEKIKLKLEVKDDKNEILTDL
jgi:hypothetical protein